ncbi:MAG: hypothetical protein Q9M92_05315 [Enterobacterales bacterium]|nr:hypothetical protein [Enterobacterales bacterium]
MFKLKINIDQLSLYCHKLLLQQNIQPSKKLQQWIQQLKLLAENQTQQLKEHIQLPSQNLQWTQSRLQEDTLLCHLEFKIKEPFSPHIAQQLSLAENFLVQSAQSFGVQSQGDILTGCQLPFLEAYEGDTAQQDRFKDALSFITLVSQLFEQLDAEISIKSALIQADLLVLEDQRDLMTGITVPNSLKRKINAAMLSIPFEQTFFIDIPLAVIETSAKIKDLETNPAVDNCYQLLEISSKIKQHILRKQRYILELNQ